LRRANQTGSPLAKKYLDDAIEILQTNSINRKTIDWIDFKQKVYKKASGANSVEEIYPSLNLQLLYQTSIVSFRQIKGIIKTMDKSRLFTLMNKFLTESFPKKVSG